jgi:hypothetical protein
MITVKAKAKPQLIAIIRKSCLSIVILDEYSGDEYSISDVMRRIIVVAASHNPISETDNGNTILSTLHEIKYYFDAKIIRRYDLLLNSNSFTIIFG